METATDTRARSQLTFSAATVPARPPEEIIPFDARAALPALEERHPHIFRIFSTVGIHPDGTAPITDPYTGAPATQRFENIGEHCIAVATAALRIAKALELQGAISSDECDVIVERALMHDANKPYEIMRKAVMGMEAYSISACAELEPLLIEQGMVPHLARYLVNAGKETGHSSLRDFIMTDGASATGIVEGKLAEKIVHLADDITFTSTPKSGAPSITTFLTPWERALASQFIEKYPFLWAKGLGVKDSGEIVEVTDIQRPAPGETLLGSYIKIQLQVARDISRQIQLLLEPGSMLEPELFIKSFVNS